MGSDDVKSYTTGWGSGRLSTWRSVYRHHRDRTESMAAWDASNVDQVASCVALQERPRVLDLGCGSRAGVVLGLMARGVPAVGIDYDDPQPRIAPRSWLRIARANGFERALKTAARQLAFDRRYYAELQRQVGTLSWDDLDVQCGDAHQLEFDDAQFSFVYSATVFEHLEHPDRAAAEIARVLRPGGEAYIRIHLWPSLSGGHALDWAGDEPPENSPVPPWDHLRESRFPAHVFLNRKRAADYLEGFAAHFEILDEAYQVEGLELLTPELRRELADWSEEDLTRRLLSVRLRKRP